MSFVCTNKEPISSPPTTLIGFPIPVSHDALRNYLVTHALVTKLALNTYQLIVILILFKSTRSHPLANIQLTAIKLGYVSPRTCIAEALYYLAKHDLIMRKEITRTRVYYSITATGKLFVQSIIKQLQAISSP